MEQSKGGDFWTKFLYSAIFLCFLFSHIDVGILSQSNEEARDDLGITEDQLGLLETAMYIGIVFGTILCPLLFKVMSPKIIIALAALLNGAFATFIAIPGVSYYIIFASRVIVGLFLVSTGIISLCANNFF
jgi:fucose permease